MANTVDTALRPLQPYEPYHELARLLETGESLIETGERFTETGERPAEPGQRLTETSARLMATGARLRGTGEPPAMPLPHTGVPLAAAGSTSAGPPIELHQLRGVLNLILEVRAGQQPATRLRTLVNPHLLRSLSADIVATTHRYTLKSVRGCRVAPDAIEMCGIAYSQGRAYAVVARFERAPHGWWCVFFDLIQPRSPKRR